jgi:ABC-type transport system involved in multi-copper enzyme maturation permease subunit
MLVLIAAAVLLHGLALPSEHLESKSDQVTLLVGWGERLGAVFAAFSGALSMTAEIRHGTIRPTLLVCPRRNRVISTKVAAGVLYGAGFGLIATAFAIVIGSAALAARGIANQLDPGTYAQFIVGGGAAGGLWAAIGVGLGAIVRNQVAVLIGICAWLLFVEGVLLGDLVTAVGGVTRYAPGAAAAAFSGQDPGQLLAPGVGLVILSLYAAGAAVIGSIATDRADVV